MTARLAPDKAAVFRLSSQSGVSMLVTLGNGRQAAKASVFNKVSIAT